MIPLLRKAHILLADSEPHLLQRMLKWCRWTQNDRKSREDFLNREYKFAKRLPLFSAMSPLQINRIADAFEEQSFAPGEAIVLEGDVGDANVLHCVWLCSCCQK